MSSGNDSEGRREGGRILLSRELQETKHELTSWMIPARSGGGSMLICSGVMAITRIIMACVGALRPM